MFAIYVYFNTTIEIRNFRKKSAKSQFSSAFAEEFSNSVQFSSIYLVIYYISKIAQKLKIPQAMQKKIEKVAIFHENCGIDQKLSCLVYDRNFGFGIKVRQKQRFGEVRYVRYFGKKSPKQLPNFLKTMFEFTRLFLTARML